MKRPERWACGEESVAVYFGQCFALDNDEQCPAQNSKSWLSQWQ